MDHQHTQTRTHSLLRVSRNEARVTLYQLPTDWTRSTASTAQRRSTRGHSLQQRRGLSSLRGAPPPRQTATCCRTELGQTHTQTECTHAHTAGRRRGGGVQVAAATAGCLSDHLGRGLARHDKSDLSLLAVHVALRQSTVRRLDGRRGRSSTPALGERGGAAAGQTALRYLSPHSRYREG